MSAYDLCRSALVRINASQGDLRAFVTTCDEDQIDALRAIDGSAQSPLGGLPIGVKDIIDTAAMPTTYGSRIYDGHRPVRDAAIVDLLQTAGGVVIGKTATTEFATWSPTNVQNPRRHGHTPGGSSAGSAAAVAAGLVPAALGTQTLGSIIRPASYCGVFGFKPTFGRLPTAGVKPLAKSLDTIGMIGTDVQTIRRVYECLAGSDTVSSLDRGRYAFHRGLFWHRATTDAQDSILKAMDWLRAKGLEVGEVDCVWSNEAEAAVRIVHDYEMREALDWEFINKESELSPSLVERLRAAERLSAGAYHAALAIIADQRAAFDTTVKDIDAIFCLSATGEAPFGLSTTGDPTMNTLWTALHLPCISLPVLIGTNGLPIGLQIVAHRGHDTDLLNVADKLIALGGALAS
jgi:Asp-tRNA(Asn)/Glu-tRNA(Gln) amidotransferase A subunit family amidase